MGITYVYQCIEDVGSMWWHVCISSTHFRRRNSSLSYLSSHFLAMMGAALCYMLSMLALALQDNGTAEIPSIIACILIGVQQVRIIILLQLEFGRRTMRWNNVPSSLRLLLSFIILRFPQFKLFLLTICRHIAVVFEKAGTRSTMKLGQKRDLRDL